MALVCACVDDLGPEELEDLTLIELRLVADSDTLLLLAGDTKRLSVEGIYVQTEENTVTNVGVLADTSFTFFTTDTVVRAVSRSSLDWTTSDETIAQVNDGTVEGINAGSADISASYQAVVSQPLHFRVSTPQLPPDLIVDPPPTQLVFQDSALVSGWIQTGLDAILVINDDTVGYAENGRFLETVRLDIGQNQIQIKAVNPDNGLSTTRTKLLLYYPIATAGITGHWVGETLTRPFSFDISEPLPGVYEMDGTLTVDVTLLGGPMVVEDIVIFGLIRPDGTIDASLSKEASGVTVSGTLEGIFLDKGTAQGSYTVSLTLENWPTVSHTEDWTAERQ
jgi:hypothetical protein